MSRKSDSLGLLSELLGTARPASTMPSMDRSVWKPSEGPIDQPRFCGRCGKETPGKAPGVVSFHICTGEGWKKETIKGEVIESTEL